MQGGNGHVQRLSNGRAQMARTVRDAKLESRAAREFEHGERLIIDDRTWAWIEDHARGGLDHLLLVTSDPYLLAPGMHELEGQLIPVA